MKTNKQTTTTTTKPHGFQFHVYNHRMLPTFTSSYILEGGFGCHCKMADLAFIVCPPDFVQVYFQRARCGYLNADEKENKLILQV